MERELCIYCGEIVEAPGGIVLSDDCDFVGRVHPVCLRIAEAAVAPLFKQLRFTRMCRPEWAMEEKNGHPR